MSSDWRRFCSAYVHVPVDLHRISADDLCLQRLCKENGNACLADSGGAEKDDDGLVHFLLNIFFRFIKRKQNPCRPSVRTFVRLACFIKVGHHLY